MIDDRKIMRRQVPDDVDVMLKQSQIHTGRVVIIKGAESSIVHQLADPFDRSGEQEGVINHDLQVLALRQFNQLLRLCCRASEWFFDENMLAVLKSQFGKLKMRPHRRHDRNDIDLRARQYIHLIGSSGNVRVRSMHSRQGFGVLVANRYYFRFFLALEIPDNVRSPVPIPYYTHAQDIARKTSAWRKSAGSADAKSGSHSVSD